MTNIIIVVVILGILALIGWFVSPKEKSNKEQELLKMWFEQESKELAKPKHICKICGKDHIWD